MKIAFTLFGIVLFVSFSMGQLHTNQKNSNQGIHKIIIEEVIQTTSYTYLYVNEDDSLQWVAVPKMEAKVGETYYYKGGMLMGEFKSKELNRTFDQILFLASVRSDTVSSDQKKNATHVAEIKIEKETIELDTIDGGITISELLSQKDKYTNKTILIKGKVTKFSQKIMSRNWIHIQDGTNHEGDFDLTITSNEVVKVGDVIVIKGLVTLDKDFGYGYFYKVIIENGMIVK